VPLDRRGEWYRYHHLFRDMLVAELHREDPESIPVRYRRAAAWYERSGAPDQALEYWMKAGEVSAAARLVGELAVATFGRGRAATAERWFRWLEEHNAMDRYPANAILAAMLAAVTGKPAEAERWARAAEHGAAVTRLPDGSTSIQPWLALLWTMLCRDGADQMRVDAELAASTIAPGSFFRSTPVVLLGMALLITGDEDRADAAFEDAVAVARTGGIPTDACISLAERALLAMSRGAQEQADRYLSAAQSAVLEHHLAEYPLITIVYAAAARAALHRGDRSRARAELTQAQRVRPGLTYALPQLAARARIELARCHLALLDVPAVQTLLDEVDEILVRRPHLGVLAPQAEALRAELSQVRSPSAPGASALTTAELRLLPMLATHLSLPEIAQEQFLSRHTIKSQAVSVYRKLGATSRSAAVARARELGLLEG